jgi:hypothetical protein
VADTLAGALTPKALIWNVMQITKIHFLTSAAREPRSKVSLHSFDRTNGLLLSTKKLLMGSILTLARFS